jgi:hypothetical protein
MMRGRSQMSHLALKGCVLQGFHKEDVAHKRQVQANLPSR